MRNIPDIRNMEKTPGKRWHLAVTSICLMLIFSVLITSCKWQAKTNAPQDEINTIPDDPSVKGNQATKQTYVDPLFYIDGQLCQHVRRIFQDKSGNLWFGTNVYDLMRYNGDSLEHFTKTDGLGGGRITAIVEDKEGNVWFGTYGGLTKFDGRSFTNFTEKDGLLNNEIWSLIIDSNGQFWIGTNEGVSRFDGKEFTTFPIPKARVTDTTTNYAYDRITCILEDRNGSFWFGTDGFGICKYDPSATSGGKTFSLITKKDGLPDNNVGSLMEDSKGNIWIGTMFGGVSLYDPSAGEAGGKSFANFTENGIIDGIEVGGFYEDENGNIWFAAENFGVYRYNGKSFTNFSGKDGLNTNGVLSILEDKEGRFWFGGWGGLFRYYPSTDKAVGKSFVSVTKNGPWAK